MEAQSELRLQSKNGQHQFSVYVRDDGRLAAVPYHKNAPGEWVAGPIRRGRRAFGNPNVDRGAPTASR